MPSFKYPKKPKAPKASASAATHEKYHQRVREWESKCRDKDKEKAEWEKAANKTAEIRAGKSAGGKSKRR